MGRQDERFVRTFINKTSHADMEDNDADAMSFFVIRQN